VKSQPLRGKSQIPSTKSQTILKQQRTKRQTRTSFGAFFFFSFGLLWDLVLGIWDSGSDRHCDRQLT
jgi:hypothetical protein